MPILILKFLRWIFFAVCAVAGFAAVAWAAGALYFDLPAPYSVRVAAALVWTLGTLAVLVFWRMDWRALGVVALGFACIAGWWSTLQPSLNRDWKPDLAVMPYAEVNGDEIVVHNVRNFEYRTETDFTQRFETRTYHLSNLRSMDAFQTYWGSPAMAHPIMSFDFGSEGRLAFSIEVRYEKGETYSPFASAYRRFELITLAADERDVIRLRTNIRPGEDVYLYRLNVPLVTARRRFLEYINTINDFKVTPHWYNALTHNCATTIRMQMDAGDRLAWDWRLVATGYGDKMLYELGKLDTTLPFDELKKRAYINPRAIQAGNAADFSEQIRTHLPPIKDEARK